MDSNLTAFSNAELFISRNWRGNANTKKTKYKPKTVNVTMNQEVQQKRSAKQANVLYTIREPLNYKFKREREQRKEVSEIRATQANNHERWSKGVTEHIELQLKQLLRTKSGNEIWNNLPVDLLILYCFICFRSHFFCMYASSQNHHRSHTMYPLRKLMHYVNGLSVFISLYRLFHTSLYIILCVRNGKSKSRKRGNE